MGWARGGPAILEFRAEQVGWASGLVMWVGKWAGQAGDGWASGLGTASGRPAIVKKWAGQVGDQQSWNAGLSTGLGA